MSRYIYMLGNTHIYMTLPDCEVISWIPFSSEGQSSLTWAKVFVLICLPKQWPNPAKSVASVVLGWQGLDLKTPLDLLFIQSENNVLTNYIYAQQHI